MAEHARTRLRTQRRLHSCQCGARHGFYVNAVFAQKVCPAVFELVIPARAHRALLKLTPRHGEGTLTHALLAGLIGDFIMNSHGARIRARGGFTCKIARPRSEVASQSLQRVHRTLLDFARRRSESASRRAMPAEGSSREQNVAKALKVE